jgi:hypothetical protein
MEDQHEKDDALKELIVKEGLMTVSPGFTNRVMALVEANPVKARNGYKPLLSRKAWLLIFAMMLLLSACSWWILSQDNTTTTVYTDTIKPVIDFMNSIQLNFHFNYNVLPIASIAFACMGLLLSLDIFLSHKFRRASA